MVQQKQEYNSSMWMIMMTLMMLVVLGLLYYIYTMRKEYVVKCMTLKCPIPEQQQQQQQQITAQAPPTPPTPPQSLVQERDVRVLRDELYPPLNRPSTYIAERTYNEPRIRAVATQDTSDTYRLVGYLVAQEDKGDTWKLFARETHRGGRSEFYATPANRNYDMKVKIEDSSMRDIYNMPDSIFIMHPMFAKSRYQVVELPQSSLDSPYI